MMVMEKYRDIAILMSMGARAAQIRKIFVFEGALIGAVGTTIGLVDRLRAVLFCRPLSMAETLDEQVYALSYVPFEPRAFDGLWIAAAAMAVSLLATLYPARNATGSPRWKRYDTNKMPQLIAAPTRIPVPQGTRLSTNISAASTPATRTPASRTCAAPRDGPSPASARSSMNLRWCFRAKWGGARGRRDRGGGRPGDRRAEPGEWVRYSTPEGAEYVAICLPAFSPETVHRDR